MDSDPVATDDGGPSAGDIITALELRADRRGAMRLRYDGGWLSCRALDGTPLVTPSSKEDEMGSGLGPLALETRLHAAVGRLLGCSDRRITIDGSNTFDMNSQLRAAAQLQQQEEWVAAANVYLATARHLLNRAEVQSTGGRGDSSSERQMEQQIVCHFNMGSCLLRLGHAAAALLAIDVAFVYIGVAEGCAVSTAGNAERWRKHCKKWRVRDCRRLTLALCFCNHLQS
eukprot:SAG31_NODE_7233_length_1748_cov_2.608854_2_plen_229_part_00